MIRVARSEGFQFPVSARVLNVEYIFGVLESSSMLERGLVSHSGVEKVPILLVGDALCRSKQSLSEGRLGISRLAPHLHELNGRVEALPCLQSYSGVTRGGRVGDLNAQNPPVALAWRLRRG